MSTEALKLDDIEQYRMQMAGICTAAIGYWKEGDPIHPDYDTLALRDVAKLYAKYAALAAAPAGGAEPETTPAGWKRVLVNEGFDGLMDSLERAHRKGYMPDAITEDYEGFDYRASTPTAQPQPTLLNGLTDQETAASASVAGLSGAQPEAPAAPSRDEAIRVWHKHCSPFASRLGTIPASPVIDAMLEFATPAPAAQQPAELTDTQIDNLSCEWVHIRAGTESEQYAELRQLVRAAIKAQGGSQ